MRSPAITRRDVPRAPAVARGASVESKRALPVVAVAYAASALIVFISILVQLMTAGMALFAPPAGADWPARWQAHLGYGPTAILVGSILLIAFSVAARQPWRWTGGAVLLLVLSFAQGFFVQLYETHDPVLRLIAALHVVNAGVLFWLSIMLLSRGADALRSAFSEREAAGT